VLTPTPDIMTLLLMALPMIVLYEICIWLAWLDRRNNRLDEEREAREREERLNELLPPGCDAEDALGSVNGDTRKDGDDRA
jgi:cytochrome c-type biogenesis protein CcmH/NrfF